MLSMKQSGNSRIQLLVPCIGGERATFISVLYDCYLVGLIHLCSFI